MVFDHSIERPPSRVFNNPLPQDPAFLDRADIIQHIGCPGAETCYAILRASLNELIRCQIINSVSWNLTLASFSFVGIS